ncbi:MAG: DUF4349 domain-containing protein [Eubacteriales bacterium]
MKSTQCGNRTLQRKISLCLVLLLCLFLFPGCGSTSKYYESESDSSSPMEPGSTYDNDADAPMYLFDREESYGSVSETTSDMQLNQALNQRKIIYSSYFSIQTAAFDDARRALDSLCSQYGAYYESADSYGSAESSGRSASFTVRVPAENYNAFRSAAGDIGTVVHSSENNTDVTENYFDTEARLESAKIREERLLDILRTADTLDNVLLLESELADVRYEIESLSGTLRKYDSLVSYSTVTIDLREVFRPVTVQPLPATFGERMSQALSKGCEDFSVSVQNMAVTLSYHLPALLLVAVIVILVLLLIRRRIRRKKKKTPSEPAVPTAPAHTPKDTTDSAQS